MPNQMTELTELGPGIYEGQSPAKNEVRRFILIPDGLTEKELDSGLQFLYIKEPEKQSAFAHLIFDLGEKMEEIGGKQYIRFLADSSIEDLREWLDKFKEGVENCRERESREGKAETRK